jgi:hypothetical protein
MIKLIIWSHWQPSQEQIHTQTDPNAAENESHPCSNEKKIAFEKRPFFERLP